MDYFYRGQQFQKTAKTGLGINVLMGSIQMNGVTGFIVRNHHSDNSPWLYYAQPLLKSLYRILIVFQVVPLNHIIQAFIVKHDKVVA